MSGSTSHTPAATWHAGPFDLPNDGGDPYQFSSIMKDAGASKGLIAKLLDRSQWLKSVYDALATGVTALDGTVTTHTSQLAALVAGTLAVAGVKLTSQSITRVFWNWIAQSTASSPNWYTSGSGLPQQEVTGTDVYFPLDLPHGATLTAVSIAVDPDTGHFSMPSAPALEVHKLAADGTRTMIASKLDPSADLLEYTPAHTITASGLSETINRTTHTYYAVLRGEGGATFVAGLVAGPVSATFTTTAIDKGAA